MSGALTREQILEIWLGSVDSSYAQGFLEAGEGNGLEAYTQGFAQMAVVSEAIDITFQSLFIAPWSGQTNPSAQGEAKAQVTLTIARSAYKQALLCFPKGQLRVEELATDWGREGTEYVSTGRIYVNTETVVFFPGEVDPMPVAFEAEKPGYGYNYPLPGTIRGVVQTGILSNNDGASIAIRTALVSPTPPNQSAFVFTAKNQPDVPIPEHVGQYYLFTAGSNTGRLARVARYFTPTLVGGFPIDGGIVEFADERAYVISSVVGTFEVGELLQLQTASVTIGWAKCLGVRSDRIAFEMVSGVLGTDILGDSSGATATIGFALQVPGFVAETGTAEWRVLQYEIDWVFDAFNEFSPSGGRLGMLDLLGAERGIYRSQNEPDSSYQPRVWNLADTVAPNALLRILNRIFGPNGITFTFREVGRSLFPGLFYDAGGSAAGDATHPPEPSPDPKYNFAYDMDFTTRPDDAWKVFVDTLEMRGFFVVGLKKSTEGLFGFFYDGTTADPVQMFNAYDRTEPTAPIAYDGFARQFSDIAKAAYDALNDAKAGGVGYEFVLDPTL